MMKLSKIILPEKVFIQGAIPDWFVRTGWKDLSDDTMPKKIRKPHKMIEKNVETVCQVYGCVLRHYVPSPD